MFGRKKKEETPAMQYNPLQDNDSEFPMPALPSQEQPPQSFNQQPTQSFTQERPKFPQQQVQQPSSFQQQPKKAPQGRLKIIGGEIVENGFRYIVLSDMSMKIGDEIDWFE